MIIRNQEISVVLTSEELAEEFCRMDGDEQAAFFSFVGSISARWKNNIVFQLQAVTDSQYLTIDGRRIMELLGEYAPLESAGKE